MSTSNGKKPDDINLKLIRRLTQANLAINLLKQELAESKESWMLYLWGLIEEEIQGYQWRTNPPPFLLDAMHKSKSLEYKISITDVVAIVAEGRTKYIYLRQKIKNTKGELYITNKIPINDNKITLDSLCAKMDGLKFHLVQVSKNAVINLAYYHYANLNYTMIDKITDCKEVNKIKAGKPYIENYKDRKMYFDDVISLQRLMSGYKEKMEDKI